MHQPIEASGPITVGSWIEADYYDYPITGYVTLITKSTFRIQPVPALEKLTTPPSGETSVIVAKGTAKALDPILNDEERKEIIDLAIDMKDWQWVEQLLDKEEETE